MQAARAPLKIALIVDSLDVSPYVADLARWAAAQPDITLSHAILQQVPADATRKRWNAQSIAFGVLYRVMVRLEMLLLKRGNYATHFERHNIAALVPKVLPVTPQVSASRLVYRYTAEDVARIRAEQFDVLIRCGSGILRGDSLRAAKYGILSFHHGDNRTYRGIPAAFWEVLHREPSTGFIIQQLTEELDGGQVLMRGAFPTQRYWLRNQAELYQRSNHYMKMLLQKMAVNGALPVAEEHLPYTGRLYTMPKSADLLRYLGQLVLRKVSYIFHYRLLRRQQHWGVAFARSSWRQLVMWKATRIPNPPGRFLADPFVIRHQETDYCFVEDFDLQTKRGVISVYALQGKHAEPLGIALDESFHLSFPYLFEYQGHIYLIPESAQQQQIRLYEAVEFPLKWRLKQVLMDGVFAADTMVFEHEKRWWMLTNLNPLGNGDRCSELYAFYSDDPLSNRWEPHEKNPLIIDSTRGRNGGLLREGDTLFRMSQYYGFTNYGASSTINRIVELTPETYCEEAVCTIEPKFFDKLTGTHHMHSNGDITVFDYAMVK